MARRSGAGAVVRWAQSYPCHEKQGIRLFGCPGFALPPPAILVHLAVRLLKKTQFAARKQRKQTVNSGTLFALGALL